MTMTQERILTAKQEAFCQGIFQGMTQFDAYKSAYEASGMLPDTIYPEASKLMDNPKISTRIKELRDAVQAQNILSIQKKREILAEIASNKEEKASDRINSIDTDNKMIHLYSQPTDSHITIELVYDSSRLLQHKDTKEIINGEIKELTEENKTT
jgi:phage terminase small subunit